MGVLNESAAWENSINQIETTDPVLGGTDGVVNKGPRQLANRTQYLKSHLETAEAAISAAAGGYGSMAERMQHIEKTTTQADFNFAGMSGVSVTHNMGATSYMVNVEAAETTSGDLGDVCVVRAANAFSIYNTGGFKGKGRYQVTI